MKKFFYYLSTLVISLFLISCSKSNTLDNSNNKDINTNSTNQNFEIATVSKNIDGDTIKVKFSNDDINGNYKNSEQTIRLIGVNTPETVKQNSPVEPYGKEASDFTKSTLKVGTKIYLEKDIGDTDKYNRLLRYVWLDIPNDSSSNEELKSKMFNSILLDEGYAQIMTIQPNVKYQDYFLNLQKNARQNQKGLWSLDVYKNEKTTK